MDIFYNIIFCLSLDFGFYSGITLNMNTKVDSPVVVHFLFDRPCSLSRPTKLFWHGREYPITKIGLHHTYRQGSVLFHVFSVISSDTFFRLVFNSQNLSWLLEEVGDGQSG